MTQTTGKKKLFRMTTKRKIVLGDIISSINIRLSSYEEDGLSRLFIIHNDKLSEEERAMKLEEADRQLKHYSLLHDVLEVYTARHWDFLLELHMKEKRDWKNEYDIPLDVYNQAIDDIISLLTWFHESSVMKKTKEHKKDYNEKVDILLLIKQYRNEQERLSNEA